MDQWLKENIHGFMLGLGTVLVAGTLSIVILYLVIRHKVKKRSKRKINPSVA